MRLRCALSGGNAEEGLPHLRLSLPWPLLQLDGEGCQLLGGDTPEKRFQQYLGVAQACIEIVVEAIEHPPTGGGLYGRGAGDVVSYFVESVIQPLERVARDPQLMEKARALFEQHMVQEAVRGGSALSGIPWKRAAFEGSTVETLLMCLPRPTKVSREETSPLERRPRRAAATQTWSRAQTNSP